MQRHLPALRRPRSAAAPRALLGATALAIATAFASTAWAQQPSPPPPADGARPPMPRPHEMPGRGPGPHRGGPERDGHGGMHGFGAGFLHGSPERMNRSIDRMLDGLGASDAQRAQIKDIAAKAAADVRAQVAAGRGQPGRDVEALLGPQVDAAAVEAARQQRLQRHDQISRRISQAMIDMARVLTPEQRAKAQARLQDARARMEDRRKRMESLRAAGDDRAPRRGPGMAPPAPSAPR